VTLLIVGVAAVLTPIATLALRADVGELLIGGALALAAAAGVGRLAAWRWGAWDERERAEARRERARRLGRWHVLWQAVLLLAALLTATVGIAFDMPPLLVAAVVLVLAIALVGVSIDVVTAEDSTGHPGGRARGGRVRNMLKLVQAQRT
jgi:membrane protein required for beta-lactamase induction